MANSNGALTPSGGSTLGVGGQGSMLGLGYDASYDVWDPQNWILSDLVDFNYAFAPQIEGS